MDDFRWNLCDNSLFSIKSKIFFNIEIVVDDEQARLSGYLIEYVIVICSLPD